MRLPRLILLSLLWVLTVFAENGPGTISGTVRLIGSPPVIPTVQPETDFDACGSDLRATQSLLLGTNQTVRNVIVYLDGYVQNNTSFSTNEAVVLDQRDCEFVPRVQIARS